MTSREKILNAIPQGTRSARVPPVVLATTYNDPASKFCDTLRSIGGAVVQVQSLAGVREYILQHFPPSARIVDVLVESLEGNSAADRPTSLDNVEAAVVSATFGVAENGAVWITDDALPERVLPFICQHLLVVLKREDIVSNKHEAYDRIGMASYEFGTFIAGPSKTADIEQSLVLGAHGPKTLTVFLLNPAGDKGDD